MEKEKRRISGLVGAMITVIKQRSIGMPLSGCHCQEIVTTCAELICWIALDTGIDALNLPAASKVLLQ